MVVSCWMKGAPTSVSIAFGTRGGAAIIKPVVVCDSTAKSDAPGLKRQTPLSLSGLITAAGTMVCLATVAGMAGKFHWLLDLCSHFPVQGTACLLVFAFLLALLRKRAVCVVFAVFALLNLIHLWPQFWPIRVSKTSGDAPLTTLLVNVRTENREFAKVRDLAITKQADVVVFEEVNNEWMSELTSLSSHFTNVVAEAREDNFGIALFSRLPLRDAKVEHFGDAEVPSIVAHVLAPAGEVLLVATHPLPPVGAERFSSRNLQLRAVAEYVKSVPGPAIVLGDLNVSPWSYFFKTFAREAGLVDTTRGRGFQPTWPTMLPLLAVPIDHCLCSDTIDVLARETGPHIGSDHYPLTVRLRVRQSRLP